MSSGLDHGKAKRRKPRRYGERVDRNTRGTGPSRNWRNLRIEWDGPEFPVVVTQLAAQTDPRGEPPGVMGTIGNPCHDQDTEGP